MPLTRNLRDGQITVNDGTSPTPETLTITLDEGDLSFTLSKETIQVFDRGTHSHTRPGNDTSVSLSFSTKWAEILSASLYTPGDANTLYEMVNNEDDLYDSTSGVGQQFTLEFVFLIVDPEEGTTTDQEITFAKCYMDTFECAEGDEYNTMSYSGTDFEKKPTIDYV